MKKCILALLLMCSTALAETSEPEVGVWESGVLENGEPFAVVGSSKYHNTYLSILFSPDARCLPLISYGSVIESGPENSQPSNWFEVALEIKIDDEIAHNITAMSQISQYGQVSSFALTENSLANELINGKILAVNAEGVIDSFTLSNVAPSIIKANNVCMFLLAHIRKPKEKEQYF